MEVTEVKEHEDGSATITVDVPPELTPKLCELGLKVILYAEIFQVSADDLFNCVSENLKNKKTDSSNSGAPEDDISGGDTAGDEV